ncbi:MAG: L-Ala-D/L-Glu epimerase [bacterium]|nr:L-Ala-D/L-Glu epimerase [bacterium]
MTIPAQRRTVSARHETWPLARPFRIARGAKSEARVIVVEIRQDGMRGRGECVPYARYGETTESVLADIARLAGAVEEGAGRHDLQGAGAARNAIDCALWDLEARLAGRTVWQSAGLREPSPLVTAWTISIDSPEAMMRAAADNRSRPLLKVKLDAECIMERMRAVRDGAPGARLVIDANEAWTMDQLLHIGDDLAGLGVEMIEQPLPADKDEALAGCRCPLVLCADESCHTAADVDRLAGRYDMVNIKLDKAGGLTGALALSHAARERGLRVMVGCMVSTSLAMAPAMLVADDADIVDLDGPLMLHVDREGGIRYDGSVMHPPHVSLWGGGEFARQWTPAAAL